MIDIKVIYKKAEDNFRYGLIKYNGQQDSLEYLDFLKLAWKLIIVYAVFTLVFCYFLDFKIPLHNITSMVKWFVVAQISAFLVMLLRIKYAFIIYLLMQYFALFYVGITSSLMFIYAANTLNFPFVDKQLIAIDRTLGFDWLNMLSYIKTIPQHQFSFNVAYSQLEFYISLMIFSLITSKNCLHLQRFTVAFFLALIVTDVLATIFPALGGYAYYDINFKVFFYQPVAGRIHENDLLGLRNGNIKIYPEIFFGLVTFPSFHAICGLLLLWGFYPVIWMRWLMGILNTLLIISTPFSGGHYLIDVIGGLLIALAVISFAHYLFPMKEKQLLV